MGILEGKGQSELCPLCGLHDDLQSLSFNCPKVLEKIEVKEEYKDIFGLKISKTLSKTLSEIDKLRKKDKEE